ncbi:hypothetical protein ACIQTT_14650 [Microbacterium sp. NPDC090225]|uniref:hypothetical protein n=1 Tax=Microbacterium sp. NPDC090225 TaxID=3364207 RepID=UPI0037F893B1
MGLFRRKPKTPTPPPAPRVEAAPPTTAMPIIRGDLEAELAAEIAGTDASRGQAPAAATAPRGPAFSGRGLRLQHPPEAEFAAAHAQTFADAVQNIDGITLDYSVQSLRTVDGVLGNFEEPGSDAVAETVLAAGFYVGEVMVRQHGHRWVKTPEDVPLWAPFDLLVVGPKGNYSNPLSKAFKRVENGPEDSVAHFVIAMVAAADRD